MKTKALSIILALFFLGLVNLFSQGFKPPAEGKAVVYFVSYKKKLIPFEFFHGDRFIGEFKKLNYMRYECDPGQQLLWASSESKEFLEANLEAGSSYIVKVSMRSGFWRMNPWFTPITDSDEFFPQAATLIKEKAPYNIPPAEIAERQPELEDFISNILNLYQTEWRQEKEYKILTPEMAIPEQSMK